QQRAIELKRQREGKFDYGPRPGESVSDFLNRADVPGFQEGSRNIPRDMLAMVHKGEIVIPSHIANRMRGGGGAGQSFTGQEEQDLRGGDVVVSQQQRRIWELYWESFMREGLNFMRGKGFGGAGAGPGMGTGPGGRGTGPGGITPGAATEGES